MSNGKVLMVSWSWYPAGGDFTYIQNVKRLYESQGYEVIPFSTANERNVPVNGPAYFIDAPDFKLLYNQRNYLGAVKAAKSSIVSKQAVDMVKRILKEHHIEIAHLHNIHHYITPAIVPILHEAGVKIIWSLHDYKIICPQGEFICHGKICELCINGNFYHCTTHTCKRNSFGASLLATIDAYYYHKKGIYHLVDAFLCPSEFLRGKFIQFGFDPQKLIVTNLCYDISVIDKFIEQNKLKDISLSNSTKGNDYLLYVGRLENVKGVKTLIEAVEGTPMTLKIVGTGEAEQAFREMVSQKGMKNVEFLGFQQKASVFNLTLNSRFVVVPSEWYENYPFSVIESFLFSKPVVGAQIGGIPELVKHEGTGLLFEPGNISDLRENLLRLWNDDESVAKWGRAAREYASHIVNFKAHWNKLHEIINNINQK